ncbi:MBL fold metallo-hydrolase [Sphingomicrobium maritimum]|uniref:MBL fold metallo-hydrolase n=1 Tax=Sphingomicrobium maritimum TaxID=3133972 RepID=UPI003D767BA4
MKIRVLGSGTSSGVPRIGNDWGACDPEDPRNRRRRAAILMEGDGQRMLVDCGPDLREQLLDAEVGTVDDVIITHDHADHCHGIDDLRACRWNGGARVPIHARADTLERLKARFGYAFEDRGLYKALFTEHPIEGPMDWGGGRLSFVDQPHGGITSLGIRFDRNGRSFAYAIDFETMTEDMRALYRGVDIWLCDCVRREPHPTHAHLEMVLDAARELGVGRLILTHLDNSMDHAQLSEELPDWAVPAYDGMEVIL